MSRMKEAQKDFIIEEALKLFLAKSIDEVTMSEIAKEVEIGDATLYRYFTKKQNIIVLAAIKLANRVLTNYFNFDGLDDIEVLRKFYSNYLSIYIEHKDFYKFLNEFDAYIINEEFDSVGTGYEQGVELYKDIYMNAYHSAVESGKIKEVPDIESFYSSTTHVLLDLGKRLSRKKTILKSDENSNYKELQIMVDIILNSLIK